MKNFALFFVVALPCIVLASGQSPYVGEEHRQITSLSQEEVDSLRTGNGMGFAKLAELNHFPGPKHVLDMADQLDLSPSQENATRLLYVEMNRKAVALGEELIAAELRLDMSFKDGSVTGESLESTLLEIGGVRSRLRFAHLEAHLRQKQILSVDQVSRYDAIRGYGVDGHESTSGDHRHQD